MTKYQTNNPYLQQAVETIQQQVEMMQAAGKVEEEARLLRKQEQIKKLQIALDT